MKPGRGHKLELDRAVTASQARREAWERCRRAAAERLVEIELAREFERLAAETDALTAMRERVEW